MHLVALSRDAGCLALQWLFVTGGTLWVPQCSHMLLHAWQMLMAACLHFKQVSGLQSDRSHTGPAADLLGVQHRCNPCKGTSIVDKGCTEPVFTFTACPVNTVSLPT